MGFRHAARALVILTVALVAPIRAEALDWDLAVHNRFFLQSLSDDVVRAQLRYPTLSSTTGTTDIAYQLQALASLSGRPLDQLGLVLGIDTGLIEIGRDGVLIDGLAPEDAIERTGFLGRSLVDLQLGEGGVVQIQVGKLRPQIGRGAIFDAYAFGAMLDADGTLLDDPIPISVRLGAMLPDATFSEDGKKSPMLDLEIAYHLDRRTQIRAVGAFLVEGDDNLSPILEDALVRARAGDLAQAGEELAGGLSQAEREEVRQRLLEVQGFGYDVSTSGWLGWAGLEGEAGFGDLEIGAVALLGFGAVDSRVAPNAAYESAVRAKLDRFPRLAEAVIERQRGEQEIALLSYYLGVDARFLLIDELAIQFFGIAMSGDDGIPSPVADPDPDRTYHGFVSVAPLIAKTGIFFGGGVAHSLSSPTLASIAPDGAGLLAGGLEVEWFVTRDLRLRALAAAMASTVTHDAYGVEFDLSADAFLFDWLIASLDGGVYLPGQHFGELPPGYQVIVMLRVLFGG